MLLKKRKKSSSSFGPDGRRLALPSSCGTSCGSGGVHGSSNALFASGSRIQVRRAPLMMGGILTVTQKKFQRPMLKRRAYGTQADQALRKASLGQKRRLNGMANILGRAGKGLNFKLVKKGQKDANDTASSSDSESDGEEDRPFEPLMVWQSPHNGGEPLGLPSQMVTQVRADEYGVEETVTVRQPAPLQKYAKDDVFVPPVLAKWLRPHQREGVQFMYECVMGLKNFNGNGCILADDMGLGKTLQSVTLIYTLLKTGITANKAPTAKRVIVVCPCSLVKNWENEFVKWLGPGAVKTLALAEADRKKIEKELDCFGKLNLSNVLICSYECLRTHVGRLTKYTDCCDLLVCDEAHRLKNSDNQTSKALNSLPVKRRVLLTGTPMQNDLQEFYAMVDFTNPGILGTSEEFRRKTLLPILRGREPDATEAQKRRMMQIQQDMSATVNEFILRRVNTLNAQHLPPKLVQVVCCNLTEIQQNMYQHLVNHKDMQHVMDGKQVNCLGSIQMLMKLCNHPSLVAEEDDSGQARQGRRAATKQVKYTDAETETAAAPGADGISKYLPFSEGGGGGRGNTAPVHPEWSGKMFVLYRLMKEMRKPGNGNDKIVIVSNYTQTLDLIGRMCSQNSWGFCRLDGSITMKKRQKMVDEFNDPSSSLVAFLLSSKAGGCGLNLIGGNRLVLFDPDWNPAVDKQAAARCWRDGNKKRCFTYRFLATGTVEEKIFQRQLSKEGLQSVVDDKEQVNALSTKDLRNLFKLRTGTPSDTHDKLRCERCKIIHDNAELEALKVLPKKLAACKELVDKMFDHEDAAFFHKPLVPTDHGVTKEAYEKAVKQPMDLGTIRTRLEAATAASTAEKASSSSSGYKSISGVSKDVNRIFSNVMKVWSPGDEIADASRRLQSWWVEQWTELVPILMTMKADCDEEHKKEEEAPQAEDAIEGSALANNERGDDYQEQIGMPDEENMRDWSHHYSTDTVDDPVFRAAMRGCDAVSFVFGLEVTWSLIQQREQEEEERKALEELEAIQEMNEDDGDDDEEEKAEEDNTMDVVADSKEEAKPSPIKTEPQIHDEDDDDDDDESKMEVDGVPSSIGKAAESVSPMPSVTASEKVALTKATSEQAASQRHDSEESSDSSSSDEDADDGKPLAGLKEETTPIRNIHARGFQTDESSDESVASPVAPSETSMSQSTLETLEETARPPAKAAPSAASKPKPIVESKVLEVEDLTSSPESAKENIPVADVAAAAPAPAAKGWACETCTFVNENIRKQSCELCGAKKVATKKARRS